jgi:hypothetical protein
MIDLLNLQENKVSTDLSGYPVVFLGQTGDGKTDSLNRYLRSVAPEGKVPLFIELEDRYKAIPNLMAQRCYSIPDILSIVSQLKNPKARERFSGVVFDTMDKFEEMANRYIATNKEVEITEDIGFGKGKRYLNAQIGIITEIRNLGLPVHFTAQIYEKTDIISKKTTYQTKLNEVTKAQMFHDAFLVGLVKLDTKVKDPLSSDRVITFRKDDSYLDLKDTFGLPKEMHIKDIKTNLNNLFNNKYNPSDLTIEKALEEVIENETFESVKLKGIELGSKLVSAGLLAEAMNVLKTNIGSHEDGTVKTFNDLVETQIDLAKTVVMRLEELASKHNVKL